MQFAEYALEQEDSWFLEKTSTSPYAEGPDFLTSSRRSVHLLCLCRH